MPRSYTYLQNQIQKDLVYEMPRSYTIYLPTGDFDMTVQHKWGVMTSQFVQTFNTTNYEFKTYHGLAHSSSPQVSYL